MTFLHGLGISSDDVEEPWAGEDDPAVAEAVAGRAILLAHRAADATLAEAARRASAVLHDAEDRAAQIVQRAREMAGALVAEAEDTIAEVLGARTDDILGVLGESHRRILGALKAAESELATLSSAPLAARDQRGLPDPTSAQGRLAAIQESSRRAAARAATESRAAQTDALRRQVTLRIAPRHP